MYVMPHNFKTFVCNLNTYFLYIHIKNYDLNIAIIMAETRPPYLYDI
jgi:hypothetical protein